MKQKYSIKIHSLPVGYEYFCEVWINSATYREGYFYAQALDNRIRIKQPETRAEGFCDCYGNLIVPPIYYSAGEYYSGISIVSIEIPSYINEEGEYIHRLFGGIDMDGNVVIPIEYGWLDDMVSGYAPASRNGKWGMIDKNGAIAAPFIYDHILTGHGGDVYYYRENFPLVVEKDDKYGCISRDGREIVPCIYDQKTAGSMGYKILNNDSDEFIPKYNVFPYEIFKLGPFHFIRDDFEKPKEPDYYKILKADSDADILSPEEYKRELIEYQITLEDNRYKIGLADEDGNIILPPKYEYVRYAHGDGPKGFTARNDGRWYFIELICDE